MIGAGSRLLTLSDPAVLLPFGARTHHPLRLAVSTAKITAGCGVNDGGGFTA